jgi:hypothetical protein
MVPLSGRSDRFDDSSSNRGGQQPVTENGRLSPPDFSDEELRFARALNHLFPLEQEELPPLFFHTLRAARSDRMGPTTLRHRPVKLVMTLAACLLALVALVPALSLGLQQTLRQTHRQAIPVNQSIISELAITQFLSPSQARQMLTFSPYWLGNTPADYTYQALLLHTGQTWTKSPVVEVQYTKADAVSTQGQLTLREFQPGNESAALLIAPPGAVQSIQVNGQPALAINGQWVHLRQGIIWEAGKHLDVLYEDHGVIFWITIEQEGTISPHTLAASLGALGPVLLQTPDRPLLEYPLPSRVEVAPALLQPSIGAEVGRRAVGTSSACYIILGQPPDNS